jgi:hypothetical protein
MVRYGILRARLFTREVAPDPRRPTANRALSDKIALVDSPRVNNVRWKYI